MSTVQEAPDVPTAGLVLLQGSLQYFCLGIVFSQAVKFWHRSAEDTIYLRAFVAVLVIGGCLQTALATYKVWVVTILDKHWGWTTFMDVNEQWTRDLYNTDFFVNGLVCSICEAFLINRCWKLSSRNVWILVSLPLLAMVAGVANIYLAVKAGDTIGTQPLYMDPLRTSNWAFPCWVYTSLALDLGITLTLSVCLWRSKTGYNHLDKMLRNIIGILWESAALPCIFMIMAGGLYFGDTKSHIRHLDLFFILSTSKFYTLGLLRTLNSRKKFRKHLQARVDGKNLDSWVSNEETLVDQESHERRDSLPQMDLHEALKSTSPPATDQTEATEHRANRPTSSSSPDLDMRERGVTVRKTGFVLVT